MSNVKLFVGVCHFGEVYSSWLEICSDNYNIVLQTMEDWQKPERSYGSSADYIIRDIEIPIELFNKIKELTKCLSVSVSLHFIVEETNDDVLIRSIDPPEPYVKITNIVGLNTTNDREWAHSCVFKLGEK